jgi:2-dehydro-3-deoxyphosphogluconate aldolase / (4S)-4-hydroxy-2-oxoglutarate aldolase
MDNLQSRKQQQLQALLSAAPIVPVVVVDNPKIAVKLAEALVAGGLPTIEVTLRAPSALECLAAIASDVQGAVTGAGTVLSPAQVGAAETAGARFLVSPGYSPKLLEAAEACPVPFLPGAATPGEMMRLGERGYRHLKFFPATQSGGAAYLSAIFPPLPQFRFCPTGGITMATAPEYLSLPNVICIGGSWITPPERIERGDWEGIAKLAAAASALRAAGAAEA